MSITEKAAQDIVELLGRRLDQELAKDSPRIPIGTVTVTYPPVYPVTASPTPRRSSLVDRLSELLGEATSAEVRIKKLENLHSVIVNGHSTQVGRFGGSDTKVNIPTSVIIESIRYEMEELRARINEIAESIAPAVFAGAKP